MTNQTIEEAVEEFEEKFGSADYGINKFRQFDTDGIFLQDGTDWLRQALTAEREAAVWEALLELEGEARLAIVEWENSADYDHTTNDGLYSFIRQISLKREALTPPTK